MPQPQNIEQLLRREGFYSFHYLPRSRKEVYLNDADKHEIKSADPRNHLINVIESAAKNNNYIAVTPNCRTYERHLNSMRNLGKRMPNHPDADLNAQIKNDIDNFKRKRRWTLDTPPWPMISFAFHEGKLEGFFAENLTTLDRFWMRLSHAQTEAFLNILAEKHGCYVRHHGNGEFTLHEKHSLPVVARSYGTDTLPKQASGSNTDTLPRAASESNEPTQKRGTIAWLASFLRRKKTGSKRF